MHRTLNLQVKPISHDYNRGSINNDRLDIPPFNRWGYLPPGVYDACFEEVIQRFATNPARKALCRRLESFLLLAIDNDCYSHAYIGGDFTTAKTSPKQIDIILQTQDRHGPEALRVMEPLLNIGRDAIYNKYSVCLHFWCPGFPEGVNDFQKYFESKLPREILPLGMATGMKKGIIGVRLQQNR